MFSVSATETPGSTPRDWGAWVAEALSYLGETSYDPKPAESEDQPKQNLPRACSYISILASADSRGINLSLVFLPTSPHPLSSNYQKTYRAMYDYMAADADEVSFKDGDTIVNVQAIDEGWMYGTVQRTGKTGMLPANYVEAV